MPEISRDPLANNIMVSTAAAGMNQFYKDGYSKERIFHGNGAGFGGTFISTNDISEYTTSNIFNKKGNESKVVVRFSSTASQHGTTETLRDTRGFTVRFENEDGPFDIVGLNFPIQYVIDRSQIREFHNASQVNYFSGIFDNNIRWNWFNNNPGSIHQIMMTWGDRGIPKTWRNMNGYGVNTFSFINKDGTRHWVKFHFKTMQGIEYLTDEEAAAVSQQEVNFHTYDMHKSIAEKNFPKWKVCVQIMPEEDIYKLDFNAFRLNNIWPHSQYPLIELGIMELNDDTYHQWLQIEKMAWSPSNVPQGIGLSYDGGLLDRVTAYPLVQKTRLGRDVNPLSDHVIKELKKFVPVETWMKCEESSNNSIYRFAKSLFNIMTHEEKDRLYSNLARTLKRVNKDLVDKQMIIFANVDEDFANGIREKLND
jgi:catalase